MTAISSAIAGTPPASRSRTANGSVCVEGVDGRSKRGRRYRDLLDGFVSEYGATEESDLARCRAAATLALSIEDDTAKLIAGELADVAMTSRTTVRLQRTLNDLTASQKRRRRVGVR